eukprot:TRINITY_DN3050_c0_g2_i3.p1 TRINITY_DN3050_c0_g2~~TRINITY_DN3050_c0_g2_i3.p1  ORF type:complete len:169 (+),score=53.09 TRINITY_DN3050_c0_g2_i3:218-724(+)
MMVKENADLKVALFEIEKETISESADSNSDNKKLKVISEIQEILAEVIYAYKTMSTNAREFADFFTHKHDQAKEFISVVDTLPALKKAGEQTQQLKNLAEDVAFLQGFPLKPEFNSMVVGCLKKVSESKAVKLQGYVMEIDKYKSMLSVANAKIEEYEERLAMYYCSH